MDKYHKCHTPVKGKDKTPEQKATNLKIKEHRIIVENSISQIKKFRILKGVFPYRIGDGGYSFEKLDKCFFNCAAMANVQMRNCPIRQPRV